MGLVVQDNQVSVAHVEPREMLASILSIEDVLIDNKRCAFCVGCIPTEQEGRKEREGGREKGRREREGRRKEGRDRGKGGRESE